MVMTLVLQHSPSPPPVKTPLPPLPDCLYAGGQAGQQRQQSGNQPPPQHHQSHLPPLPDCLYAGGQAGQQRQQSGNEGLATGAALGEALLRGSVWKGSVPREDLMKRKEWEDRSSQTEPTRFCGILGFAFLPTL